MKTYLNRFICTKPVFCVCSIQPFLCVLAASASTSRCCLREQREPDARSNLSLFQCGQRVQKLLLAVCSIFTQKYQTASVSPHVRREDAHTHYMHTNMFASRCALQKRARGCAHLVHALQLRCRALTWRTPFSFTASSLWASWSQAGHGLQPSCTRAHSKVARLGPVK